MGTTSSNLRLHVPRVFGDTVEDPYTLTGYQNQLFDKDEQALLYGKYSSSCNIKKYNWTPNLCTGGSHPPCPDTSVVWQPPHDVVACANLGNDKQCGTGSLKAQQCAHIRFDKDEVCPWMDGKVAAVSGKALTPNKYDNQRRVTCSYAKEQLASSCAAATDWTNRRREELADADGKIKGKPMGLWFDDDLMKDLCSRRAPDGEGCPESNNEYVDADGKPICSNLIACPLCRKWGAYADESLYSNDIIDSWCGSHFDVKKFDDVRVSDPSCRCYNIHKKPGLSDKTADPRCWYGPCQDREFMTSLVPSHVRSTKDLSCPENICTQIINAEGAGIVDIDDVTFVMQCGDKDDDDEPNPPKPPTPKPDDGDIKNPWDQLTKAQRVGMLVGVGAVTAGGAFLIYKSLKMNKQ